VITRGSSGKTVFYVLFFVAKIAEKWHGRDEMTLGLIYVVVFLALGIFCFAFLAKS